LNINQKGNTLITVLLVTLIFSTLGLAIVSSSLGGQKRVETRETDMNVSYNSIRIVENLTIDMTHSINKLNLKNYMYKSRGKTSIISSFDSDLQVLLRNSLSSIPEKEMDQIECVNIVNVSSNAVNSDDLIDPSRSCIGDLSTLQHFNIETDKDFTRVFEIVLVTKNPEKHEGKFHRTIKKRIIFSPLPSFLKYAVGSNSTEEDSGLFFNGSPNIIGNVYANQWTINERANYQLRNGDWAKISTPKPSINGEVFSSSANLLPIINNKHNFYKEEVPTLKHDSQFIDIDFPETFNERMNEVLLSSSLPSVRKVDGFNFKEDLIEQINLLNATPVANEMTDVTKREEIITEPLSVIEDTDKKLINSYMIDSKYNDLTFEKPLKFDGNLVILSSEFPITFQDKLIVDGDLYVVSYENINLTNVYVTGNIYLVNFDGKLTVENTIISANNVSIESNSQNTSLINTKGIEINGDIVTGEDLNIHPIDSSITFNQNIMTNGSFRILGDELDDGEPEHSENDEVIFNSVVYVGDTAFVSNINIFGAEDNQKQLILLANNDLVITRLNEFNNFSSPQEDEKPYLPIKESKIKPLKAFFYTESSAELYGVGSLFFIDGGIFAKKKLEINAIRGAVKNINNLPSEFSQKDQLSRFIVNYNQDVLLQRIDALPLVKKLQIISDELIIE
jgi:hypothetical protein